MSDPTLHSYRMQQALEIAWKLLNGLLTDNQLDFKQPDGSTARQKMAFIKTVLGRKD